MILKLYYKNLKILILNDLLNDEGLDKFINIIKKILKIYILDIILYIKFKFYKIKFFNLIQKQIL